MLTASCLLTTSLDGLEGPPFSPDGGLPNDGGGADIADATITDSEVGSGNADGGSDGGQIEDAPILDADANRPSFVVRVGGVLRGIAEHGAYVYWVQPDLGAGIARVRKDGEGMSAFVEMTENAFDVAVDDEYVYWSTGGSPGTGNEVHRKSLHADGSSGAFYFSGSRETLYLAAGIAGLVYVTGFNSVAVGPQRPLDAGTSEQLYPMQDGAIGIAVFGMDLYWSSDAGIVRGSVAGLAQKGPQPLYRAAPGEAAGIATDGREVFWIGSHGTVRAISPDDPNATPREVCRASAETSDAESDARPDADGGTSVVADIAVDDEWVYFTEPAVRQISKCRKR